MQPLIRGGGKSGETLNQGNTVHDATSQKQRDPSQIEVAMISMDELLSRKEMSSNGCFDFTLTS